jgi:phage terminase small subunit
METLKLTPKQERFATEYGRHHNASLACREAGYSAHGRSASVTGARLLANVCVLARIQALEAALAREMEVTREGVVQGLLQAFEMAKADRQPGAMISAMAALAKLLGFYAVETTRVELTPAQHAKRTDYMSMTDAQLLAIVGG